MIKLHDTNYYSDLRKKNSCSIFSYSVLKLNFFKKNLKSPSEGERVEKFKAEGIFGLSIIKKSILVRYFFKLLNFEIYNPVYSCAVEQKKSGKHIKFIIKKKQITYTWVY